MSSHYNNDKNNTIQLHGRVTRINEFCAGKAAQITMAVPSTNGHGTNFVKVISFAPECYNHLKVDMLVHAYGHIKSGKYEKNGKTVFTQDVVADDIEFPGNRASVDIRAAAPPAKLNVMQRREFYD